MFPSLFQFNVSGLDVNYRGEPRHPVAASKKFPPPLPPPHHTNTTADMSRRVYCHPPKSPPIPQHTKGMGWRGMFMFPSHGAVRFSHRSNQPCRNQKRPRSLIRNRRPVRTIKKTTTTLPNTRRETKSTTRFDFPPPPILPCQVPASRQKPANFFFAVTAITSKPATTRAGTENTTKGRPKPNADACATKTCTTNETIQILPRHCLVCVTTYYYVVHRRVVYNSSPAFVPPPDFTVTPSSPILRSMARIGTAPRARKTHLYTKRKGSVVCTYATFPLELNISQAERTPLTFVDKY